VSEIRSSRTDDELTMFSTQGFAKHHFCWKPDRSHPRRTDSKSMSCLGSYRLVLGRVRKRNRWR
jgi:hypothetical protein